ncbi:recombinase family protein (plasmid) [Rhodococcus sp. LW-XY12]|nr:recombinase family protein [Rhodococcus sp. LW-XY12]
MRIAGRTLESICSELNNEGIPTPAGSPIWYRSHVHRLLGTRGAKELSAELTQSRSADQGPLLTTRQCARPIALRASAGQLPPRTSRAVHLSRDRRASLWADR